MTFKHYVALLVAVIVTAAVYFSGVVDTENLLASTLTGGITLGMMGADGQSFTSKGEPVGATIGASVGVSLTALLAALISISTTTIVS